MQKNCAHKDCRAKAVSFSEFCWAHTEEKQEYIKTILKKIEDKTSFEDANLSYVDLSGLELKEVDFKGATLTHANLSNSRLWHSEFEGANLTGAELSGADISSADFSNAQLFKANLSGCRCWNTDFTSANLVEADLIRADLLNAKLFNARLWHAVINGAKSLSQDNFRSPKAKVVLAYNICEKRFREAKDTYSALKQYFLENGKYLDVHWASFREMTMDRLMLLQEKDIRYIPSLLMGIFCGYGEKPFRVIFSSAFIILFYAAAYFWLDAITPSEFSLYRASFLENIYYSIVTFTTLGYGDLIPRANAFLRLLAGSEAFIGAFMMGLFVFTLARRYSAR